MSVRGSVGGSGTLVLSESWSCITCLFRMPLLYCGAPLGPGEAEGCKGGGDGGVRGNRILSQMAEQMQRYVDCMVDSF
jgi:hypothetical protein